MCDSTRSFSQISGLLPPRLEWEVNPPRTTGRAYLLGGRIRVLGMRSTQSHPRLIPAAVARLMETAPHSGQRNGASGSRGGCVGTSVELYHSPCSLGQYGSGQCHNRRGGSGSASDAPVTVPTLLLCSLRHSIASPTHSGGSKHCGRCTIQGQA